MSEEEINRIKNNLHGITTGFGTVKAWTPEQRKGANEQQRRIDSEESKRNEVLHNNIGF